jgi:hypothetical protein
MSRYIIYDKKMNDLEKRIVEYMDENKIPVRVGSVSLMTIVISQMIVRNVKNDDLKLIFSNLCDDLYNAYKRQS